MTWAEELADDILSLINKFLERKNSCNIFLTGGRAAKELYLCWSKNTKFYDLKNVNFYFGDERCVNKTDPESNYGSIIKLLFEKNNIKNFQSSFIRMKAERHDIHKSVIEYSKLIPDIIDILLLGVGEDGHIASLFPNSFALDETSKKVLQITGPKYPFKRLTITPRVIKTAKHIYVLAPGDKKDVYLKVKSKKYNYRNLPAQLVSEGKWILTK